MRKHAVKCRIENEFPTKYARHISNRLVAERICKILSETGLGKEAQVRAIDQLIGRIREEIS